MLFSDLRIAALVYVVTQESLHVCLLSGADEQWVRLADLQTVIDRMDRVKWEVRRTMSVARGRVPRLREFAEEWGRMLLPGECLRDPPDVLVIIPHSILHDVPLHLVSTDAGMPLGAVCGVCYCSSMSLFMQCTARNRARRGSVAERTKPRARIARNVGATDVLNEDDSQFQSLANYLTEKWPHHFSREVPESHVISTEATRRTVKMDTLSLFYFDSTRPPEQACLIAHGYLDQEDHRYSGLLVDSPPGIQVSRDWRLYGRFYRFPDRPLREVPPELPLKRRAALLSSAEITLEGECRLDLLALLGCSAGAGRILSGDEPASLAETFLNAGCVSIIGALWDADVEATRGWIDHFLHSWIDKGRPKALAARDALKRLSDEGYGLERTGVYTLRGDWL